MKIENDFSVNAHRDVVWQFLMDTEKLAACLPGCEQVIQLGPDQYEAEIKVQISFMKLKFKVDVSIKEMQAPSFLRSEVEGKPIGVVGKIKVDASMNLIETDTGTRVSYEMDIRLTGKLGSLGQSLYRSKAEELGLAFAENVRSQLEVHATAPESGSTPRETCQKKTSKANFFVRIWEKIRNCFVTGKARRTT